MALLIDKWAADAPTLPHLTAAEGLKRWLQQAGPVMAASVLSLWRKDRKPQGPASAGADRAEPNPPPVGADPPPADDSGADWRRRVFEDGPISVAVLDPADRLLESNAAFQALVGSVRAQVGNRSTLS